jgi:hypothetical protein
MSAFGIFLVWYFGTMLISLPLTYQWINYLLKEHRRKEIGKRYPSTTKAIRAEVKIGPPLEFSAGADDFELTEKGVSVVQELEITINSENSPLWMQPPTQKHKQVIMPRGMGGFSSALHARDIDPLVQTAIDFHATVPLAGGDPNKKDEND